MDVINLESLEKSLYLSGDEILAVAQRLGIKHLYKKDGICFLTKDADTLVSYFSKELPEEDLIADKDLNREFPEYPIQLINKVAEELKIVPVCVSGLNYYKFEESEKIIEECKKHKPQIVKPKTNIQTFRLCILENNVWYVVHSGEKSLIRTWADKYINRGYMVKIKPNVFTKK